MAGSTPGTSPGTEADAATGPRVGDVLDGRYRLEQPLAVHPRLTSSDGGTLWRAADIVLSRTVAVRLLLDPSPGRRAAFLSAATTSCRVSDPLVAATYDAADLRPDETGEIPGAYIVREWVDGRTLHDLLREGPLPPERAISIVQDVTLALAHLHKIGVAHGQVHPANVFVRHDGQVRLADPVVGAALTRPGSASGDTASASDMDADLVALGNTLYAALTGRWPTGPWRDLPAAPRSKTDPAHPLSARQVRAGVTRELDAVVAGILDLDQQLAGPRLRTAAAVATALGNLPTRGPEPAAASLTAPLVPAGTRPPISVRRRRAVVGSVIAFLVLVGIVVGGVLAADPGGSPGVPAFTPPATTTVTGGSAPGAIIPIVGAASFDPPPGDGNENPAQVGAAHDGNPGTAWQTQTYTTANLGNAKPGVGLIFDLGSPRAVADIHLQFLRDGTDVDIRAMSPNASAPGTSLADFPLVARQLDVGTSIDVPIGTTSRYWLVWLTKLPRSENGFRGSVAEASFVA